MNVEHTPEDHWLPLRAVSWLMPEVPYNSVGTMASRTRGVRMGSGNRALYSLREVVQMRLRFDVAEGTGAGLVTGPLRALVQALDAATYGAERVEAVHGVFRVWYGPRWVTMEEAHEALAATAERGGSASLRVR